MQPLFLKQMTIKQTNKPQVVDKRIVMLVNERLFILSSIRDPSLHADAFRGRSAEPPRRKLLRGLITPFFRRSRRIALRIRV